MKEFLQGILISLIFVSIWFGILKIISNKQSQQEITICTNYKCFNKTIYLDENETIEKVKW